MTQIRLVLPEQVDQIVYHPNWDTFENARDILLNYAGTTGI